MVTLLSVLCKHTEVIQAPQSQTSIPGAPRAALGFTGSFVCGNNAQLCWHLCTLAGEKCMGFGVKSLNIYIGIKRKNYTVCG